MSKTGKGLLRAAEQKEEIPSWDELTKDTCMEAYGLKLPNSSSYWVPLLNPKNKLAEWEDIFDIFSKIYDDVRMDKDGTIHFTIMAPNEMDISIERKTLDIFRSAWVHVSYTDSRKLFKTAKDWNPPESVSQGWLPIQSKSYETLEWLGDSIIQSIIANYLSWRFPDCTEGFLTKARSKLVRTGSLGTCAKWLGFSRLLIMSRFNDDFLNSRDDLHLLEDSFEAFIGCLSKATSIKYQSLVCTDIVFRLIEQLIDIPVFLNQDDNYKELLMQYYHKAHNGAFPTYSEQGVDDSSGVRLTKMAVHDPWGAILATGSGTSKKEAEQNAAKMACIHYNIDFFNEGNPYYLSAVATNDC